MNITAEPDAHEERQSPESKTSDLTAADELVAIASAQKELLDHLCRLIARRWVKAHTAKDDAH